MASAPLGLVAAEPAAGARADGTGGAPGVMGSRGDGAKEGEGLERPRSWRRPGGRGSPGVAPREEWPVLTRAACPQAGRSWGVGAGSCWGRKLLGIWRPDGSGCGARGR